MDRYTVNHPESGGRSLDPAQRCRFLKKYELEKTAVAVQPITLGHTRRPPVTWLRARYRVADALPRKRFSTYKVLPKLYQFASLLPKESR
jgi:hypothetical protein